MWQWYCTPSQKGPVALLSLLWKSIGQGLSRPSHLARARREVQRQQTRCADRNRAVWVTMWNVIFLGCMTDGLLYELDCLHCEWEFLVWWADIEARSARPKEGLTAGWGYGGHAPLAREYVGAETVREDRVGL